MGYDDYAAAVSLKVCLQPGNGFHVQVVGGLVKEKDIRFGQQELAQGHPGFLAAGQGVDGLWKFLLGKAKTL